MVAFTACYAVFVVLCFIKMLFSSRECCEDYQKHFTFTTAFRNFKICTIQKAMLFFIGCHWFISWELCCRFCRRYYQTVASTKDAGLEVHVGEQFVNFRIVLCRAWWAMFCLIYFNLSLSASFHSSYRIFNVDHECNDIYK